jgi:pimeloyl-ACP methyl ester carboxylesterase
MTYPTLLRVPVYLLAVIALAGLGLGGMLAAPLRRPPALASIHAGAVKIDQTGKPPLTRFQARDGTWLAYRLHESGGERVAILVHGSSASSDEMNAVGKALAADGVTAVAIDIRGHGASGERGDIGYIGQIEDDLADLLDQLRSSYPNARFELVGHSLGGGFAARIAGTPVGRRFDRIILLAPFLGAQAPTNQPDGGHWAMVDSPRILALVVLRRLGISLGQSLPVIAYANNPGVAMRVTNVYSFRLLADYGPGYDWAATKATIAAAAARIKLVAGADDELMRAEAYARELRPLGVDVTILPGVDHMGVVYAPAALHAIAAAAKGP